MTAVRVGPGPLKYHAVRLFLKVLVGAYVRTSVVGTERLPATGSYIICFNHPSWLDPVFLAAAWPDRRRRLFIFGPREADMSSGLRNRLITWTGRGVPFKPDGRDAVDATRRAVRVLHAEACLAVAGEGRLSDHEGHILPLEAGLAHFARLSGAPIVPTAIVGTRWIHLGSRVTIRIGDAVSPADFPHGRTGTQQITEEVAARLAALLDGVEDRDPPGWIGRTISEAFNDRPWLAEASNEPADREPSPGAPSDVEPSDRDLPPDAPVDAEALDREPSTDEPSAAER